MEKLHTVSILKEIASGDCLPSPSPVLIKLVNLAADDRSSHTELTAIIEQDPSLAVRVMKMANSVAFSLRETRAVSSVPQAILIIGYNRLRILALSLSLRESFPLGKVGRINYELFWKSSLFRAHAAEGLARLMPGDVKLIGEEVFTAALILEIGLLVLFHLCPNVLQDSFPEDKAPLEDIISWEENHLGLNHRRIGEILLNRWRFPDEIVMVQRRFGLEVFEEESQPICMIVELARTATEVFFDDGDMGVIEEMVSVLGLNREEVSEVLLNSFSRVEETAAQLCIDIGSDQDIPEAMERANQALAKFLFDKPTEGARIF
jgi:HD-like signal output (HDOD) protein